MKKAASSAPVKVKLAADLRAESTMENHTWQSLADFIPVIVASSDSY
jgi:hypothetical protein